MLRAGARMGASNVAEPRIEAAVAVLAVALMCTLLIFPPSAPGDSLRIDVALDQTTTLVGRHHSLRTVVEDLCWRAGVDLRSYDAEDRPFAARITGQPLAMVLSRLLRHESYMIGASRDRSGRATVIWIRVLGDHETAKRHRAGGGLPRRGPGIQLPPTLLRTAFGSTDPTEREQALGLLVRRIQGDPAERQAFLDTETNLIAKALSRYPQAPDVLKSLEQEPLDPSLRRKLKDVLRIFAKDQASAAGQHAAQAPSRRQ